LKTRSSTRNYISGLATGYIASISTVLIGLWLVPFALNYLDREQYAIFALTGDFLVWLSLLELGISAGLNVHAAQLTGKPDQEKLNRLASTTFYSQLVVVAVLIIIGIGLSFIFPNIINAPPDLRTPSIQIMLLMVLSQSISMSTKTFSVLLIAHQQIYVDNLIRLGLVVIRTIITVVLLVSGFGLISLAVGSVIATIITSALAVWRAQRFLPDLQIKRTLASWSELKSLLDLGIWFSLGGLAGMAILHMDRIVTSRVVALEAVTTLTLTGRLYLLSNSYLDQITNTARPMLGKLFGKNDKTKALELYRNFFLISTGGALIAGIGLWTGNQTFVEWWVGNENYGGRLIDTALLFNLIVNCWVLPNRAVLSSAKIVKPQTLSRLVEGGFNILFSILLGLKFGIVGVIFGTSLASLITSFWYLPKLTANLFEMNVWKLIKDDFLKVITLSIILIPIAITIKTSLSSTQGLGWAILQMLPIGVIGALLMWFFGFNQSFRIQILTIIRSIFRKIRFNNLNN